MDDRLKPLIQRAVLEIVEYGHQVRSEMEQFGRKQPFYVMSYLKRGEALLRLNGEELLTKPGSVVLIRSGEVHDHIKTSQQDAEFLWWHFNFNTSWHVDVLRLLQMPVMVQVRNTDNFETYFHAYLESLQRVDSIPGQIYKNARALDVLACLLENFITSDGAGITPDIPEVFFHMLEEVTAGPNAKMSLDLLAQKYHLNPTYISNAFKKHFGMSPIYLHRQVLIESSKEHLLSTSMNIGEIAAALGFADISAFTRFFTDKVGLSPSKFRNRE